MSSQCPKWGTALKTEFRKLIENRKINPTRTDKAYILHICDKYFKGRPDATFVKNFNTSVAEWRVGHYINEYNKGKGEISFNYAALKDINSPFAAASMDEEEEEYDSAADEDFSADEEDEESLGDIDTRH
jgi:hypothetical protein